VSLSVNCLSARIYVYYLRTNIFIRGTKDSLIEITLSNACHTNFHCMEYSRTECDFYPHYNIIVRTPVDILYEI